MGAFLYPTGVSSGYSGLASYMAGLIGTVTGFSGMSAPASPTGNDGFLQAMADSIIGTVGYQAENQATASAANSVGPTSFTDVPGYTSWTFTAPRTGWYLFHIDVTFFVSVLGVTPDSVTFQLVAGSGSYTDNSMLFWAYRTSEQFGFSFRARALCASGSNTIKLQWKCGNAGTTLNTNTLSQRKFTVVG